MLNTNATIHSTAEVADNTILGSGTVVHGFCNLYGCVVGERCVIGAYVEIQKDARVGDLCKIQSHSFICSGVTIGNRVFVGHGVMFTNDRNPRATNDKGMLENAEDWQSRFERTTIEDDVVIGSNASILCGIHIGKRARIGLGAVVVEDVPAGATVVGNPAKVISK